jgi:hypothetical protein
LTNRLEKDYIHIEGNPYTQGNKTMTEAHHATQAQPHSNVPEHDITKDPHKHKTHAIDKDEPQQSGWEKLAESGKEKSANEPKSPVGHDQSENLAHFQEQEKEAKKKEAEEKKKAEHEEAEAKKQVHKT